MQHSKKDPQVHSFFSTENFGTVQAVLLDAEDSIADLFKHACSKLPLPSPPVFFQDSLQWEEAQESAFLMHIMHFPGT